MENPWYYEYILKTWDEENKKEEDYYGIIPANNMTEAMSSLENYYGDEIMEVKMLKPIIEGPVFEFQLAMDCNDFDFSISRKM